MQGQVFVFGSNLAGRHGAGAALHARKHYRARYGQGIGRQGQSYAIPTKATPSTTLPLDVIASHVSTFLDYARAHPGERFYITEIGCGLAGYTPPEIAPMFRGAPDNCLLSLAFRRALEEIN